MAETFFGPWVIVFDFFAPHTFQRFTISGSDNADGQYEAALGASLELPVEGEEWRIQIEWLRIGPSGSSWQPSDVHRTTKFVVGDGLIVQLDAEASSPTPHPTYMRLTCTSMDPATNPIPMANPYDFTIPEHQGRG